MPSKKKAKPKASSWHNIKQASAGRGVTNIARKRRAVIGLRGVGLVVGALCLIGGIGWGIHFLNTKSDSLDRVGATDPLRNVYFETNGVLTQNWLLERLDLPQDIALSDVDIESLRAQLLQEGQTVSVTVEKRYPDALMVNLQEREPLFRLVILDASGRKGLRLVGRDGHVYHGEHYALDTIKQLPFLDVAKVEREGNGYAPIGGMDTLSRFVQTAREKHPQLYANWRIVSTRDFTGNVDELGATIRVITFDKQELTFSPSQFDEQLVRLERILAHAEENHPRGITHVDLSYEEPIVKLAQLNRRTSTNR